MRKGKLLPPGGAGNSIVKIDIAVFRQVSAPRLQFTRLPRLSGVDDWWPENAFAAGRVVTAPPLPPRPSFHIHMIIIETGPAVSSKSRVICSVSKA